MSGLVLSTTDENFTNEVLESETPVLVDFWAPWCGPCKMIAPLLDQLATTFGDKLKIVKVNVDENTQTPSKYQVMGIPTLLIFKSGEVVGKQVGALTPAQLNSFVEEHIDS
jgi:thioredoxin 1